jgi:site-specific DNA-methyltransferase (adenine-specific)
LHQPNNDTDKRQPQMIDLDGIQLHHGDCRQVLASLPDCSVDSVVTDPPYELGFMGKAWDGSGIAYSVEMWAEVLRVLKPGGHLCAFGGTRTYHRMACAIEDAGFEIRDSLHWTFASGFPKSLDVSKAIDKAAGAEREVIGFSKGVTVAASDNRHGGINRGAVGIKQVSADVPVTTAATDAAKQWEGWGTALKPAHEPIVLARRPLIGTVAANVLTHGTGALNIDGARVGSEVLSAQTRGVSKIGTFEGADGNVTPERTGRWPANVIFDTEAGALLDQQSGVSRSQTTRFQVNGRSGGILGSEGAPRDYVGGHNDSGGASRFFTSIEWDDNTDLGIDVPFRYVPKPGKQERNAGLDGLPKQQGGSYEGRADGSLGQKTAAAANVHPTVKPLALMRWLVRLVTPPGGTVLEPFAGSGTTLMACVLEGFNGIGIEMTDEYLPIIEGRVRWAQAQPPRLFL